MATSDYAQAYIQQDPNYKPTNGADPRAKLIMIFIIILVLGGVFLGATTLLGSSSGPSNDSLTRVISRQNEVEDIIDNYGKYSSSLDTTNRIVRTDALMSSHTQDLEVFSSNNVEKGQAPVNTSSIDDTLNAAAQGSRFDQEIETILDDLIQANLVDIKAASEASSDEKLVELLNQIYADQLSLLNE